MINLSKNFIGNNKLIENLLHCHQNKTLSNSLIFSGQKGIGKTTLAFSLIKEIYNNLSSQRLNNTNLIYNNTHPNIRFLINKYDEKNNKLSKNISINQIRDLENFLNQSTFDNLSKFVIIDSADDLNKSSANALLKSLEEPKNNTFFILIAHQISNLLPTIISRCHNYVIDKPTYENYLQILQNNNSAIDLSDANFLYSVSNGSPGLAIEIYTENILELFDNIIQILQDKKGISSNIFNLANVISKYTNEEFKNFLIILKFIILSLIKINLGYVYADSSTSKSFKSLNNISHLIPNSISLEILEFLNDNEKDLFIYNLDKKIFCFNIFSSLSK